MFEAAELGRKLSKKEFQAVEPDLHTRLLEAQQLLKKSNTSVIIIVSGVEGAGKGEVVNRLSEWLDTRDIKTTAFWEVTDEQRLRPDYWRFWRTLPERGTIGIMFGSWYTQPIIDRVFGKIDDGDFEQALRRIVEFERMLVQDGALIIKFWFHLPKHEVEKQLKKDQGILEMKIKKSPLLEKFSKQYDAFASVSERAIRISDKGQSPWHLIEATDRRYRDITVGQILLNAMEAKLGEEKQNEKNDEANAEEEIQVTHLTDNFEANRLTILDHVDLTRTLSDKQYNDELKHYQGKLFDLAWKAHHQKKSVVAVFEGWDASGKGGAIRRVTRAIDARLYRVLSVAAPTDEEKAHQYLWRFWRHIPLAGYISIYDRSWYGRVLVERVEGFAREEEWKRSYNEINHFEEQLCESGIIMLKFWIHLGKDEQLKRFKEREKTPWKMHKITDEDWRNRERWDDYKEAVNDMVAHTSTEFAPWSLISGNDKKVARVEIIKTLCEAMKKNLDPDEKSAGKK
ncbi:MAG: polyphosphate:AMP phosphotransferase [Pseudohongiellaceae bacterium]|jgi:polyphosphate:AMP phosphotransferase